MLKIVNINANSFHSIFPLLSGYHLFLICLGFYQLHHRTIVSLILGIFLGYCHQMDRACSINSSISHFFSVLYGNYIFIMGHSVRPTLRGNVLGVPASKLSNFCLKSNHF